MSRTNKTISPADALADAHNDAIHGRITGDTTDPERMRLEHEAMLEAGVLDPDQPTPYAHYVFRQMREAPFTALERAALRQMLDDEEVSDG